MPGTCLSLLAP